MKYYCSLVAEYCDRYAKKENISNSTADEESEDEEDISEEESASSDDEIPGHADPWKNLGGLSSRPLRRHEYILFSFLACKITILIYILT